jgi:starvation-inducible DNA-binding protein
MLKEQLERLISNLYGQYFNAHTFHWNIKGINFVSLHEFAGELYEDVYDSIDDFAEQLRQLGFPAPLSLKGLLNNSGIDELTEVTEGSLANLEIDNQKVLVSLYTVYKEADEEKELGLANLLQDRIQQHKKYAWKLKALQNKE